MTIPTTRTLRTARLTRSFDAEQLAAELTEVRGHRWSPQRSRVGGGSGTASTLDWRVLPLRSLGGDADRTDPGGPGPVDFAPTAWLCRLPYFAEVLRAIPAPLNAVRLMALGPGAECAPHRDPKYSLGRGLVRLHVPVTTVAGAVVVIEGQEHRWPPGQLWFGDFSREHYVRNTGERDRVHMVVDALLTAELADLFPAPWRERLAHDDVLLNRPATPDAEPAIGLPLDTRLPRAFTDFAHDQSLAGYLQSASITAGPEGPMLVLSDRSLALVPMTSNEYRFAGWSEQRSILVTSDAVVLRLRRGRALQERHLSAHRSMAGDAVSAGR